MRNNYCAIAFVLTTAAGCHDFSSLGSTGGAGAGSTSTARGTGGSGGTDSQNRYVTAYAWSPDSTRIAFVQCPEGRGWACNLVVADPDLGNPQIISREVGAGCLSDWQGDWILFQKYASEAPSRYQGDWEYWKIRPDGSDLTQVTFTHTDGIVTTTSNPYWANVGTTRWARFVPGTGLVYFLANNGNGWYSMFVCNDDGTDGWRRISPAASGWNGAVSPAVDDRLVYSSGNNFDVPMDLISVDLMGQDPVVLHRGQDHRYEYAVSPDGATLAYVDGGSDGGTSVRLVDLDGSHDRPLLESADLDGEQRMRDFVDSAGNYHYGNLGGRWQPFSADSELVLLSVSDAPAAASHIYQVGRDGTGLTQVSFGAAYDFTPQFSPDGRSIAYLSLPSTEDSSVWPPAAELVVVPAPERLP